MKVPKFLLLLPLIATPWIAQAQSRVNVEWYHPDKYSAVRLHGYTRERSIPIIQSSLIAAMQRSANQYLPGDELNVRILDVSIAGAQTSDSDDAAANIATAPKISLQFRLKNKAGKVVAEGNQTLAVNNYQTERGEENDPLKPEKDLLHSWIRDLARKVPKA
jgi:hypothetical protein